MELFNLTYLQGPDLVETKGSLTIKDECIHLGSVGIIEKIDMAGYIALPGFINSGIETSFQSDIQIQVESGCSTNIVLGSIESETTLNFNPSAEGFQRNGLSINKLNNTTYALKKPASNSDDIASSTNTCTISAGNSDIFGSGSPKFHSRTVWSYITLKLSLGVSAIDILRSITTTPSKLLRITQGIIDQGLPCDLVIFKIPSLSSLHEGILETLFYSEANNRKCAGLFKNGKLIYADNQFADLYKQNTLLKYYNSKNIPKDNSDKTEFDTIEDAIEAIRILN
jgi:hypothetical protein